MVVFFDKSPNQGDLKKSLESDNPAAKAAAMKQVIAMVLNGEQLDQLFFTIVRYVLPTDDHLVQKLLLLYLVSTPHSAPRTFTGDDPVAISPGARPAGPLVPRISPSFARCVFGWELLVKPPGDSWRDLGRDIPADRTRKAANRMKTMLQPPHLPQGRVLPGLPDEKPKRCSSRRDTTHLGASAPPPGCSIAGDDQEDG